MNARGCLCLILFESGHSKNKGQNKRR